MRPRPRTLGRERANVTAVAPWSRASSDARRERAFDDRDPAEPRRELGLDLRVGAAVARDAKRAGVRRGRGTADEADLARRAPSIRSVTAVASRTLPPLRSIIASAPSWPWPSGSVQSPSASRAARSRGRARRRGTARTARPARAARSRTSPADARARRARCRPRRSAARRRRRARALAPYVDERIAPRALIAALLDVGAVSAGAGAAVRRAALGDRLAHRAQLVGRGHEHRLGRRGSPGASVETAAPTPPIGTRHGSASPSAIPSRLMSSPITSCASAIPASRLPRRFDREQAVREAVQAHEAARVTSTIERRHRVRDHVLDRRADVVAERPAVGEPVHEHFVAARARHPQVAGGRADRARRRRQLERELAQRPARHRVPDLELAGLTDDELVALDADDELDRAALEIDRVRREPATRRAHDRDLLVIRRDHHEPAAGDRGDPRGARSDRSARWHRARAGSAA